MESLICRCYLPYLGIILRVRVPPFASDGPRSVARDDSGGDHESAAEPVGKPRRDAAGDAVDHGDAGAPGKNLLYIYIYIERERYIYI